jgi:hypothetical protein
MDNINLKNLAKIVYNKKQKKISTFSKYLKINSFCENEYNCDDINFPIERFNCGDSSLDMKRICRVYIGYIGKIGEYYVWPDGGKALLCAGGHIPHSGVFKYGETELWGLRKKIHKSTYKHFQEIFIGGYINKYINDYYKYMEDIVAYHVYQLNDVIPIPFFVKHNKKTLINTKVKQIELFAVKDLHQINILINNIKESIIKYEHENAQLLRNNVNTIIENFKNNPNKMINMIDFELNKLTDIYDAVYNIVSQSKMNKISTKKTNINNPIIKKDVILHLHSTGILSQTELGVKDIIPCNNEKITDNLHNGQQKQILSDDDIPGYKVENIKNIINSKCIFTQ